MKMNEGKQLLFARCAVPCKFFWLRWVLFDIHSMKPFFTLDTLEKIPIFPTFLEINPSKIAENWYIFLDGMWLVLLRFSQGKIVIS
jgi:hypothetical protein